MCDPGERECENRTTLLDHETRLRSAERGLGELPRIKSNLQGMRREFRDDISGLRGEIRTLSAAVLKSLETDTNQEKEIGELKGQVASIATTSGAKAGKSIALKVSAAASLICAIAYLLLSTISAVRASQPPQQPPSLPSSTH